MSYSLEEEAVPAPRVLLHPNASFRLPASQSVCCVIIRDAANSLYSHWSDKTGNRTHDGMEG
jgi:hypothetical protein